MEADKLEAQSQNDDSLLQRILDAVEVTTEIISLIDSIRVYDPGHIEIGFAFGDINKR